MSKLVAVLQRDNMSLRGRESHGDCIGIFILNPFDFLRVPRYDMLMKNPLGKRIQQARKEFGITQADLAYRMGISAQSISAFESGRIVPEFKYLEKIAQFTHQPLYFFTGYKAAEALAKVEVMLTELADLKKLLQQIVEQDR